VFQQRGSPEGEAASMSSKDFTERTAFSRTAWAILRFDAWVIS
jgi:hypothetical protein